MECEKKFSESGIYLVYLIHPTSAESYTRRRKTLLQFAIARHLTIPSKPHFHHASSAFFPGPARPPPPVQAQQAQTPRSHLHLLATCECALRFAANLCTPQRYAPFTFPAGVQTGTPGPLRCGSLVAARSILIHGPGVSVVAVQPRDWANPRGQIGLEVVVVVDRCRVSAMVAASRSLIPGRRRAIH